MKATIPGGFDKKFHEFLCGFASATTLERGEAFEQWSGFSRQLSTAERMQIESRGFRAGEKEGKLFRAAFPEQAVGADV